MSRYFDRQGKPIDDPLVWGKMFQGLSYKIVQQDTLANGTFVSTVWLGMDHAWGGGPPLIFETMAWDINGQELMQDRYSTEEEAKICHQRAIDAFTPKDAT